MINMRIDDIRKEIDRRFKEVEGRSWIDPYGMWEGDGCKEGTIVGAFN